MCVHICKQTFEEVSNMCVRSVQRSFKVPCHCVQPTYVCLHEALAMQRGQRKLVKRKHLIGISNITGRNFFSFLKLKYISTHDKH